MELINLITYFLHTNSNYRFHYTLSNLTHHRRSNWRLFHHHLLYFFGSLFNNSWNRNGCKNRNRNRNRNRSKNERCVLNGFRNRGRKRQLSLLVLFPNVKHIAPVQITPITINQLRHVLDLRNVFRCLHFRK